MTKSEWDKVDTLRAGLSSILEQEPLKQALEVCLSMEIDTPYQFVGSADLLHQSALSGASREGYFRFFRNLKLLTKEPAKPATFPEPWGHIKSPN